MKKVALRGVYVLLIVVRLLVVVPLTVLALLVGGVREAEAGAQGMLVVSLGDSSASGEGNPDVEGGLGARWLGTTDTVDVELASFDGDCHRSMRSGHRLAADAFRNNSGLAVEFKSFACSGAKVDNLLHLWQNSGLDPSEFFAHDIPPQLA